MSPVRLALHVLRVALLGAFMTFALTVGWIGLSGLVGGGLQGMVTALLASIFYYGPSLALQVGPFGLLIGGSIAVIHAVRTAIKTKTAVKPTVAVGTLMMLGLVLLARIPSVNLNVDREITHAARWYFAADVDDARDVQSYFDVCGDETIVLVLVEYAHYDIICSNELAHFLSSQDNPIIPVTYRVTFDFGSQRSYALIRVGAIPIRSAQWLASPSGCGGTLLPACDSDVAQKGSFLSESTWEVESEHAQ